jgi:hypothetical protein
MYTKEELKELVKSGKITMESDEIILDDSCISKKEFVKTMKKLCNDSKENFSDYRKCGQKSKNKRRKSK